MCRLNVSYVQLASLFKSSKYPYCGMRSAMGFFSFHKQHFADKNTASTQNTA